MADIVVFSPEFVSHRFVRYAGIIKGKIEKIIEDDTGKELFSFTHESEVRETLDEIQTGGTILFNICTELPKSALSGICVRLDGKNYSYAGCTIFCGFREKKEYACIKESLEDIAREVEENYK